jgi:prophage maintenance system killer protein
MTTLFVFLYLNGKWIEVDTQQLYNFTVWVASSPSAVGKETVQAVEKFLKTHLVNLG